MNDNKDMRECIRKFDNTLSLKANKGELVTIQTFLETKFISTWEWDNIKYTMKKLEIGFVNEQAKIDESIAKIMEEATSGLKDNLDKAIKNNFKEYENVMNEFNKFFD